MNTKNEQNQSLYNNLWLASICVKDLKYKEKTERVLSFVASCPLRIKQINVKEFGL